MNHLHARAKKWPSNQDSLPFVLVAKGYQVRDTGLGCLCQGKRLEEVNITSRRYWKMKTFGTCSPGRSKKGENQLSGIYVRRRLESGLNQSRKQVELSEHSHQVLIQFALLYR